MPTNPNDPAFPEAIAMRGNVLLESYLGLTKREDFAKAAMMGILANSALDRHPIDVAALALDNADFLIKRLNEEKK